MPSASTVVATGALWLGGKLAEPAPASGEPPPPGFEEVRIPSGSGSTLAAWFLPGQNRGVIVLMHSVRATRREGG